MSRITIGKLSKETAVKVTTIRYYETIGLLDEPDRSESGQRRYDKRSVERLAFIRHARDLGFPLDAIRELISLQVDPSRDCRQIDVIARKQLEEVRRRSRQLAALEAELVRMVDACAGGRIDKCSVLASLGRHERCAHNTHDGVEALDTPLSKKA